MDAELALLRKLHQIATLHQKLANLEVENDIRGRQLAPRDSHERICFEDVQCAVSMFTGDDTYIVKKWIADFDGLMDGLGASQNIRLLFARRLLSGSASLVMKSAVVDTWRELKQQLILEFDRPVKRHEVYKQLANGRCNLGKRCVNTCCR